MTLHTIGQVARQSGVGVDIEPGRENDPPLYGCRTYTVEGKTTGVPPVEWLVAAFHERMTKRSFPERE